MRTADFRLQTKGKMKTVDFLTGLNRVANSIMKN